jgi:hypothetical protein
VRTGLRCEQRRLDPQPHIKDLETQLAMTPCPRGRTSFAERAREMALDLQMAPTNAIEPVSSTVTFWAGLGRCADRTLFVIT